MGPFHAGLMNGAIFYALRSAGDLGWSMFRNSEHTLIGRTFDICEQAADRSCVAMDKWIAEQLFLEQEHDAQVAGEQDAGPQDDDDAQVAGAQDAQDDAQVAGAQDTR